MVAGRVSGENAPSGGTPGATTLTTRPAVETRPVAPNSRDDSENRAVSSGTGRGTWSSILRTLMALAVVAGLIFALRFALKRFGGRWHGRSGAAPMSVLARTGVSARQQLLLVRLGRRLILVGSGPEGMAALAEVSDPAEVAELVQRVQGSGKRVTPDDSAGDSPAARDEQEGRP